MNPTRMIVPLKQEIKEERTTAAADVWFVPLSAPA
jgi:hypothetical protein